MSDIKASLPATLGVIIPASNEEALIGPCLEAVLRSDLPADSSLEVIVVANGCKDGTAQKARSYSAPFQEAGHRLTVLDLPQGGKLNALNAGDAATSAPVRAYLDADVTVGPDLLRQISGVLATDAPRYSSGHVLIPRPRTWASRAYARYWRRVPFMTQGVPGCGLFAVNAAGRARWGAFPDIISDDTYVRLSFAPQERILVDGSYDWPIAEGFTTLVRVRRRQDAGVEEIRQRFPDLLANDDDRPFPLRRKLALGLRDPLAFFIYTAVAVLGKLTRGQAKGWSRGR